MRKRGEWWICFFVFFCIIGAMQIDTSCLPAYKRDTEFIKERIYGAITLLAVNIGLFTHRDELSSSEMFTVILTTSLGLWLAGVFAGVLSSELTKENLSSTEKRHRFRASLGILDSAKASLILGTLAIFGIISVQAAVVSAVMLSSIEIIGVIVMITLRKEKNFLANSMLFVSQIAVFSSILFLKIGH